MTNHILSKLTFICGSLANFCTSKLALSVYLFSLTVFHFSVVHAQSASIPQGGQTSSDSAENETQDNSTRSAAPAGHTETALTPKPEFEAVKNLLTTRTEVELTVDAPRFAPPPRRLASDPCKDNNWLEILGRLKFGGRGFNTENAACIIAYNDAEADRQNGTQNFINPANPDYLNAIPGGSRAENPAGFYILVSESTQNTKQFLCTNPQITGIEGIEGSDRMLIDMLSPRYQRYRNGQFRDGVCICQAGRTPQLPEGRPVECMGANFERIVNETRDFLASMYERRRGTVTAAHQAAAAAESTDRTGQPAQAPNAVVSCVDAEVTASANCRAATERARTSCRQADEENQPANTMGDLLGVGADMNTMMRAGTGTQATCMKASAMAMTAQAAIRSMGRSCNSEVESCKNQCQSEAYDRYIQRCFGANANAETLFSQNETLRQKNERIRESYSRGAQVCGRDLRRAQDDIGNMLSGLGNSLQSSMRCACQTSNAPGANCDSIPNINNCAANPGLQGCQVYGALGSCVPGSAGYDAKTCNCLQNPSSAGCSGAGATTPATLFGGNLRGTPVSGGNNMAGGSPVSGGSGGTSNLDLSGRANDLVRADLSSASGTTGAAARPGNTGGGAGVSGGGGGNGAAEEPAAAAAAAEDAGIKGLFNQAKNAMLNAIGRGGGRNATRPSGNGKANNPNMKKFKPLRGIAANQSGMGTKNMDIWKMVNMCANGETCASNVNNYMQAP